MNKKFDAVKMMREIRDRLSMKYTEDPDAEKRDLEEIRKKYRIKKLLFFKNQRHETLKGYTSSLFKTSCIRF